MRSIWRMVVHIGLLTSVAAAPIPAAAGQPLPSEYEVKAAFLYNILSFVEWPVPAGRSTDALRVCMLGAPGAASAFDGLNGRAVAGRKIEVVHLASFADQGRCSVLFIGSSEERTVRRIIRSLRGGGILSIGDTAGFGRQGVMINFYLDRNKVRFEVNAAAAREAGFIISSKLLKLAGAVYGSSQGGE